MEFVRASLPGPPARVLEVGAGAGELAAVLREAGYDVLAIDPAGEAPGVQQVALADVDQPVGSFDAAVASLSLHHVEPLEESLRRLGDLVRPGGRLVVDEFDLEAFDKRALSWWIEQHGGNEDPVELLAEMRHHLHPLPRLRGALSEWFELENTTRGAYLNRWHMDGSLLPEEERLIAAGELPATGARFVGTRR